MIKANWRLRCLEWHNDTARRRMYTPIILDSDFKELYSFSDFLLESK